MRVGEVLAAGGRGGLGRAGGAVIPEGGIGAEGSAEGIGGAAGGAVGGCSKRFCKESEDRWSALPRLLIRTVSSGLKASYTGPSPDFRKASRKPSPSKGLPFLSCSFSPWRLIVLGLADFRRPLSSHSIVTLLVRKEHAWSDDGREAFPLVPPRWSGRQVPRFVQAVGGHSNSTCEAFSRITFLRNQTEPRSSEGSFRTHRVF